MAFSVIIADDNPALAQQLCEAFREGGYEVLAVAGDGRSAIQAYEARRPDLLVLDLVMPLMDGFGVLEYVRAHANPALVVIYSAISDDAITARAFAAGAAMYYAKPQPPRQLLKEIDALLRHHQPARHAAVQAQPIKDRLSTYLRQLMVPANQLGYRYLHSAIYYGAANPQAPLGQLYRLVAAQYETTPANVERCMRHSIESAWNRCPPKPRRPHSAGITPAGAPKRPTARRYPRRDTKTPPQRGDNPRRSAENPPQRGKHASVQSQRPAADRSDPPQAFSACSFGGVQPTTT